VLTRSHRPQPTYHNATYDMPMPAVDRSISINPYVQKSQNSEVLGFLLIDSISSDVIFFPTQGHPWQVQLDKINWSVQRINFAQWALLDQLVFLIIMLSSFTYRFLPLLIIMTKGRTEIARGWHMLNYEVSCIPLRTLSLTSIHTFLFLTMRKTSISNLTMTWSSQQVNLSVLLALLTSSDKNSSAKRPRHHVVWLWI
jgi:hypothetical protein